jgi:tRNA dimethylallyltransferase
VMERPRAIAVVGPTASGKTALSVEVARRLDGEVISMDSRQVYRGMDVGTAKATPEQRGAVPHHGLDLIDPDQRFSAGEFARRARRWIEEIRGRGRVPLLVGGTGFFLRSLTHPIFRQPALDPERRHRLETYLQGQDTDRLRRWLRLLDPSSAARLEGWGGRQRLLRALEMPLLTGRSLTWWHARSEPEADAVPTLVFVLVADRERLFATIDRRVDDMVEQGLVEEVRSRVAAGFDESAPGMTATGYVELIPYLRGERSLEDALELVRRNTRAYARRQMTWFRHQLPEGAMVLDAARPVAELAEAVERRWEETTG